MYELGVLYQDQKIISDKEDDVEYYLKMSLEVNGKSILERNRQPKKYELDAAFRLAEYYRDKNFEESVKHYTFAAEHGFTKAFYELGQLHKLHNQNDPKIHKIAFDYFKRGADLGLDISQYEAARCYENGIGTPKSLKDAIHYYSLAATQKHQGALQRLGQLKTNNTNNMCSTIN